MIYKDKRMDKARIRKLRDRLGFTQAEMAQAVGASTARVVSHLETGFRRPNAIISRFFEYLESLSDSELKRAGNILKRLSFKGTHE
jgi:DNA-binding XRE family transcriptional regulator